MKVSAALTTLALAGLTACGGSSSGKLWEVDPGAGDAKKIDHLVAVLHPTQGNDVRGVVEFREQGEKVKVTARVEGLSPGKHGYHVHLYGDCTGPKGKSAGTHFNFAGPSKNPPKDIGRITGNLGDLVAGPDGKAKAEAVLPMPRLRGEHSILGRSVIVHEKPNDPSKPPIGGAGGRLACGVIGIANEKR